MKLFGLSAIWFCVFVLGMSGCASKDEEVTGSSTAPKTSVPGEDVTGGGGMTPSAGPGGAAANVHF
jgi:hypothetical protein